MNSPRRIRTGIAAILIGVLIGGGLMVVTPAGAEVSQLATNWTKIWKNKLQPLADKRYYTKSKSDKKFATKKDTYTKAETYSKTETDAKYQPKGSYATAGSSYTKAESDERYSRSTSLVRGNVLIVFSATAAGQFGSEEISFGTTFASAPTVHVIAPGAAPPLGCSGSATAPDASPGHLCIFGSLLSQANTPNTCKVSTAACFGTESDPWGASIFTTSTAAGTVQYFATWAARPTGITNTANRVASPQTDNRAATGGGVG